MRTVTYTQYEWGGNKLLREKSIDNPYTNCDPVELVLNSDLAGCDHITIKRTIRTPSDCKSVQIESLYK